MIADVALAACTLLVAIAAGLCMYQWALAAVAIFFKGRRAPDGDCRHRFAILIPAHNEEENLAQTLRRCRELDYPSERVAIYVVADNCTDRTAEIAAQCGAVALVRRDDRSRGKGFALQWAIPQVLAGGCDAVVILDADCLIDRGALRAFDARLAAGDRVLQTKYVVANPDESPVSCVLAVANVLEDDFFYAPKSTLGMVVMLRGTGMAFHRSVLEQAPWQAQSIVEDTEYTLRLLDEGLQIRFLPETRIVSAFPARREELAVQRSRWIGGAVQISRQRAVGLIARGLLSGRLRLADAGLTLLVASRAGIIAQLVATIAASAACWQFWPGIWSGLLLTISLAIAVLYLLYAGLGVWQLGLTRRRLALLLRAPVVVVQYLLLAAKATIARPAAWNRTPRRALSDKPAATP